MAEQKIDGFYTYKLSKSKKSLFQIFQDRARVVSANDLSNVRNIYHSHPCIYIDIYEFEDIAVFQFESVEYWFFQESQRVEKFADNIVFFHNVADDKLYLKRKDEIIHTFDGRAICKNRTRNAFFCMCIINGDYVLNAYYDAGDQKSYTIIRKFITSANGIGAFPQMMVDDVGSRIFTLHNGILRVYNLHNLNLLGELNNVRAFSANFAIIKTYNRDLAVEMVSKNTQFEFERDNLAVKYNIDDECILQASMSTNNFLRIKNFKTGGEILAVLENAYALCNNIHYIEESMQLIWCDNGVFKKLPTNYFIYMRKEGEE